jgi:hypothetical protein
MAFGTAVHGVNGMLYSSGVHIESANAFTLNKIGEVSPYRLFGGAWIRKVAGPRDWNGSISGIHDQDANNLQDMVSGGAAFAILLYPRRSDLTTYYTGNVIFSNFTHEVNSDGVETTSADFEGDDTLTETGFS